MASIVCAILGLFAVPIVGGILGIVFGTTARRRIAQDPTLGGAEMARAGIIVGWIGVVLTLLAVLFLIVIAIGFRSWHF